MKVLGFDLLKGQIRYSVLEGTKDNPTLVDKNRHKVIVSSSIPDLMDWFETTFESLINRLEPDRLAYRLALEPRRAQISYLTFPYAILNLIAYRKGLSIAEYTSGNFVASKFGLDKKIDMYEYCDEIFGTNPPYWDKNQKYSIIAAWLELD